MVVCERARRLGGRGIELWNHSEHSCANRYMSSRLDMLTVNTPWLASRNITMTLVVLHAQECVTLISLRYITAALLSSETDPCAPKGVHDSALSLRSQTWFLFRLTDTREYLTNNFFISLLSCAFLIFFEPPCLTFTWGDSEMDAKIVKFTSATHMLPFSLATV
jgi:hypothetical protein